MHTNPHHSPSSAAPAKVSPVAGLGVGGAAIVVSPAGGPRPSASAHPAVRVPGTSVGICLLRIAAARVLVAAAPAAVGLLGVAALGIAARGLLGAAAKEAAQPSSAPEKVDTLLYFGQIQGSSNQLSPVSSSYE